MDLRDEASISAALNSFRPDAVVNLAALSSPLVTNIESAHIL